MIEVSIRAVLSPLRDYIDDLATSVTAYESRQVKSSEVLDQNIVVDELRKDVYHLKSTDFISLIAVADDEDAHETSEITHNLRRTQWGCRS